MQIKAAMKYLFFNLSNWLEKLLYPVSDGVWRSKYSLAYMDTEL